MAACGDGGDDCCYSDNYNDYSDSYSDSGDCTCNACDCTCNACDCTCNACDCTCVNDCTYGGTFQIANIEYFKKYCNYIIGTNYTWDSKQAINIEWLVGATQKVYNDIHQPKDGCRLLLSSVFSYNVNKQAVNTILVNKVVQYLTYLNKICDNDCECPCATSNCAVTCGNCSVCCNECECDCGNVMECECDCDAYWNCNCTNTPNYCVWNCACACNCCDDCCHSDDCHFDNYTDNGGYSDSNCHGGECHGDSHSDNHSDHG